MNGLPGFDLDPLGSTARNDKLLHKEAAESKKGDKRRMSAQHNFSKRVKMLGLGTIFGLGLLGAAAPAAEAKPPRHAPAHGYRRKTTVTRYRTVPRYTSRYNRRVYRNGRWVTVPTYRSRVGGWRRDIDGDGIRNRRDRDIDGDGIHNRRDRDTDGDGVRDSRDDYPRNPRRR